MTVVNSNNTHRHYPLKYVLHSMKHMVIRQSATVCGWEVGCDGYSSALRKRPWIQGGGVGMGWGGGGGCFTEDPRDWHIMNVLHINMQFMLFIFIVVAVFTQWARQMEGARRVKAVVSGSLTTELDRYREQDSQKLWSVEATCAPCNGTTQAASSTGSVYLQQW